MKFGVVVFPGSNCDKDCFHVLKEVVGVPVSYIWHRETDVSAYDCIVIPGGFSYGDYLRTGAIARFSPVMNSIIEFAHKGGLVIGICNGFQVLLEAGLLPGAMLRNRSIHFICKYVYVKVERSDLPFTKLCKKGEVLKIPIAHNEGNYYCDEQTLERMKICNQIVFRYCAEDGTITPASNPNGAVENIAGICNEKGNVLGMMPHPERCSEEILRSRDGLKIFSGIVESIVENAAS